MCQCPERCAGTTMADNHCAEGQQQGLRHIPFDMCIARHGANEVRISIRADRHQHIHIQVFQPVEHAAKHRHISIGFGAQCHVRQRFASLAAAGHPRRQSFLPDWRRADRSQTAIDVWAACRFLRLQGGWHDVQAQVAVQTGRCISRQSVLSPQRCDGGGGKQDTPKQSGPAPKPKDAPPPSSRRHGECPARK